MGFKVAIDGPAGSGKSTLVKGLAERYGFRYLDTGAMYRACGLFIINAGFNFNDIKGITKLIDNLDMRVEFKGREQHVFVNGTDYTPILRTPAGDRASSEAGKLKVIRDKLVALQRAIANDSDVVMDGRDIGTCVLPDADVKILLTANRNIRVNRRRGQLLKKGIRRRVDEISAELVKRDYEDTNREHSPLCAAADAICLDTSNMSASETLALVSEIINERYNKRVKSSIG